MVAGAPARMGFLWGLALPLFFFCWVAGAPRSSAGPSTSESGHTEVPAVTPGVRTSSEGVLQTTDLTETSMSNHISLETQTLSTQTSDKTFLPGSTISVAENRENETMALIKIMPSKSSAVISTPMETSATGGGSPTGRGMSTVETVTVTELSKATFDTLCNFDSSEEAKRIMVDFLKLAHTSTEAEALSSESSASSDSSVPAIATSQALSSDIAALAKALVTYNIINIEVINCSVIEIEATASTPGTSDIDRSPTGGKALSTPETSALPDSTEAKSHLARTATSAETLSTASATESATPDITLTISSTTEMETTAAKATAPSGTLVTVSMNLLEENSSLSVETTSHTEVSGAVTISTGTVSTVGEVTSPAGFSATVYSLSEVTTIMSSTPSETSTTDITFSVPVPNSRSPLPSVHLATANNSQEKNITLAKTTASAKTLKIASTAEGKPSTATPTNAQTSLTDVTAGEDGGFLLLRLSVASPEDLTAPRVAERLMQQLDRKLHVLFMSPIQVSLLRVRRG
ncbi:PREDICTED: mucin-20 [Lipotes vexillifer]|uniref:Mucin-20 n=1 Tax=Lipotes vexillifer TaxID=118797 RepID=A0A340WM29_LIPVE|nr:PREDICTED: mucin-20 [Lipotes vexillifer]